MRTSVRSEGTPPSVGSFCTKSLMGTAVLQAESSNEPSMRGGENVTGVAWAVLERGGAVICACATPAAKARQNAWIKPTLRYEACRMPRNYHSRCRYEKTIQ